MVRFCLSLCFFLVTFHLSAQMSMSLESKPIIDSQAITHWPGIGREVTVSNNGKYFAYTVSSIPHEDNGLVIQATDNSWKKQHAGDSKVVFSNDNRTAIFMIADTLRFLDLASQMQKDVRNVTSWKYPQKNKGEWIAYTLDSGKTLVVLNCLSGKEKHFDAVADYSFDDIGNSLLIQQNLAENGSGLLLLDLAQGNVVKIWSDSASTVTTNCFDADGSQVAFLTEAIAEDKSDTGGNWKSKAIWQFKKGMNSATLKVSDHTVGIKKGLYVGSLNAFSNDGRYIYFTLQQPEFRQQNPDFADVDIWNYRDPILQSTQLYRLAPPEYVAAISVTGEKVVQLETEFEKVKAYPEKGDFVVMVHDSSGDRSWIAEYARHSVASYTLVSLKDGSRKELPARPVSEFWFSPSGNYLVYYQSDTVNNNYYSYAFSSGKVVNISAAVPSDGLAFVDEFVRGKPKGVPTGSAGFFGFLEKDAGCLIWDNYDIWLADLSGKKAAVNLTNGFGRKNGIRLARCFQYDEFNHSITIKINAPLILKAFDTRNKFNGFYQTTLQKKTDPKLLVMGPWTFNHQGTRSDANSFLEVDIEPVKARNAESYVVKRQSNNEAPNYFLSEDLVHFEPLTHYHPQENYNWLTGELVEWALPDGTITQGILYKPEDFDSTKKYPVLFNYYEQLSQRLYEFPRPTFTEANIDIPWLVSRGYLVFTPDIYFTRGRSGQSACDAVTSAAEFLAMRPYVDPKRMGLNGHSFAGYLTNYIITHTDLFAAVVEGAGTSDAVSSALELQGKCWEEGSRLPAAEASVGASIWDRPDLYLEGSPILRADKVTAPLIIFHSKIDCAVPWEQAVELFTALRRLDKPVWMLQYDNGNHAVDGKDAVDFTMRITQFFDHYLKGAPAPVWMTRGVPARLKKIERGYELDPCGMR
jgi:dipeptidyl aminopeptidase/acylaminoacyl peptidase